MKLPKELRYTESHEWIADNGDGTVTVGITAVATEQLGDLVYVELPQPGARVSRGANCAVVESTKAAAEVYAPVTGEIVAANAELGAAPEKVNEDAFAAWMFRIKPANPADLDKLLDATAYEKSASA